jgi:hypothetical protein
MRRIKGRLDRKEHFTPWWPNERKATFAFVIFAKKVGFTFWNVDKAMWSGLPGQVMPKSKWRNNDVKLSWALSSFGVERIQILWLWHLLLLSLP